ncbi:MAG: S66 peptidase family protein [Sediminibacterium sp.]|jgi:muramoyltetrapeptide carboxypeptidase
MIQPPKLIPGDTIGITCPAGSIPIEKVQKCIQTLENWGFKVKIGKTVGSKRDCFSASDAERAAELQQMLDDKNLKAILCARGGYGLSRIIHQINFASLQQNPKWVVGFSDITVLHAALQKQNIMSIHGPMAAAFNKGAEGEIYIQSLKKCWEGEKQIITSVPHALNQYGSATATLIGGNLCMIAHLIGSENAMDTKGKILFIEDVGEAHYNIDRLMIQCKKSGLFDDLAGCIIGGFTELKDTAQDFGATAYEIIQSHILNFSYPICFDFPISHGLQNFAVKEGCEYTLDVSNEQVLLKER